jgi:hypothetical protein
MARLAPLALLALPFAACSSNKDYDTRRAAADRDPTVQKSFDSLLFEAEKTQSPQIAYEQVARSYPIGTGKADPGSTRILVDGKTTNASGKPYTDVASAEAGYQFAWLWDFASETVARATFTYDDNTPTFVIPFRTPSTTQYGWGGWEPAADPWPAEMGPGPALAARFRGGTFSEYGGGVGISLRTISNAVKDVAMPRTNPGIALLEQTPSPTYQDPTAGAYDVSSYEGIAIWVRRGPDGQSSMRVGLTERHSAEDLNSSAVRNIMGEVPANIVEGKYCKRWRLCGCSGGTPCSPMPGRMDDKGRPELRCFDPAVHTPDDKDLADPAFQVNYPHCGVSRCYIDKNSSTIGPDPDPLFVDDECREYVTPDGRSDQYCYTPGTDPTPPSKRERCGNPFSRAITVSTDWQLIKVPFNELRQADESDVAEDMDLTSVKQVAFSYTAGNIDYWVANIGFYRKQP